MNCKSILTFCSFFLDLRLKVKNKKYYYSDEELLKMLIFHDCQFYSLIGVSSSSFTILSSTLLSAHIFIFKSFLYNIEITKHKLCTIPKTRL
jgi:hypothetical protein